MNLEGIAARDEGMRRVEEHATDDPKRAAKWAIGEVAKQSTGEWTTDAVLTMLEEWGVDLHDNRLLGPLMLSAERAGIIQRVICPTCEQQETALSERPQRHRAPQYLWTTKLVPGVSP